MKDGEHYHNQGDTEGKHNHRKLAGLILLSVIFALIAYGLAQTAQTTADNNSNITNVFEVVVNNTDKGCYGDEGGTCERVNGTTYNASNYPMNVYVKYHVVNNNAHTVFYIYVNGTRVLWRDFTTIQADQNESFYFNVPKGANFSYYNNSVVHHVEWREYPILSGRNGTLSVNQTFISSGSSYNATYESNITSLQKNDSDFFDNVTFINVRSFGAKNDGITNNTVIIQNILNNVSSDTTGNQTVLFVPPKVKYTQSALNLTNGTCIVDFDGNILGMGGIVTYCNSYVSGSKDNEYIFSSYHHPAYATVNYGVPSISNVVGSFVNYYWNWTSNSVQTTSHFASEINGDSEFVQTLYTYTDGTGKTIPQRMLQKWYYDGGTYIRSGQYGISLRDINNNNMWVVDGKGNLTTNQIIRTSNPNIHLVDSDTTGVGTSGTIEFYDSSDAQTGFIGDSGGSDSDIYLGSISNGIRIYAGGNTRVNIYANGSVQISALAGSGQDYVCVDAGGMLIRSNVAC